MTLQDVYNMCINAVSVRVYSYCKHPKYRVPMQGYLICMETRDQEWTAIPAGKTGALDPECIAYKLNYIFVKLDKLSLSPENRKLYVS